MASCEFCQAMEEGHLLVNEETTTDALLFHKPATKGHVIIVPKQHFPIIEQVSHTIIEDMAQHAKRIALAIAKGFKAQGISLFLQNGIAAGQSIPHTGIHVLPRFAGDEIPLTWVPKQLSEEDMNLVEKKLKDEAKNVHIPLEEEAPLVKEKTEEVSKDNKDNYLLRQLRRIP
ncbi:HIT family protein [Candidatus Woesearchaeota archaeon]|nr:HIT family protein [Candidatus Woesearchaeota archaeon]